MKLFRIKPSLYHSSVVSLSPDEKAHLSRIILGSWNWENGKIVKSSAKYVEY